MDNEIEMAGAYARARGENAATNPYLRLENMPEATGEEIKAWSSKALAWKRGWTMANLLPEMPAIPDMQ